MRPVVRSATIVMLLGAEMKHQTAGGTGTGARKPLGARGARMTHTVGAAEGERMT